MKKIMFCGGGSAGHVTPNLAICSELEGKAELCYLGTDGIEKTLCEKAGISFITYNAVKFARGKFLCNLTIPFRLAKSLAQCKDILRREKPDLLFCKGGYVSLAPALAASRLKIPVITHESDLSAGLANKLIARKCRRILTTFPQTAEKFRNGVCTGSPIRSSLMGRDKLKCKRELGLDMRPTILVFGGGSGSKKINDCLNARLSVLCRKYNVIHLCGKGNKKDRDERGLITLEFADDMGLIYAASDYAVSRCGSNAANELISLKIPTLFIPLENSSSRGDQVENAEYFREKGLCRILREGDLTANSLIEEIENLIADDKLKAALGRYAPMCGNANILREINSAIRQ